MPRDAHSAWQAPISWEGFNLFDYMTILPTQETRSNSRLRGERMLLMELLADAVRCIVAPDYSAHSRTQWDRGTHAGQLRADAIRWFADDRPSTGFSFRNVCDWLDLSPTAIRRRVEALQAQGRHRFVPHVRDRSPGGVRCHHTYRLRGVA